MAALGKVKILIGAVKKGKKPLNASDKDDCVHKKTFKNVWAKFKKNDSTVLEMKKEAGIIDQV
jgi:hypothetical protein